MSVEPPVVRPGSLAEALEIMAAGEYRPLAGGTDLMVQLEADVVEPPAAVLDLWRLDELRGVGYDGYDVSIGALSTWTELRHSPVIRARLPALSEAAASIGAAQIQNRGTIGGNICNASPAGDSLPVLLAVDATFDVGSVGGQRSIPAREFWTGYRQTALRPDELLMRVRFPVERGRRTRFRKVGGRAAQAISKVVVALSYRDDGPIWTEVRLALGSVAPTPIRARRTEAVL
jgi:xanthine dehydrogenase small subunit